MKLLNPTENKVHIVVDGERFEIEPKSISVDLKPTAYDRWRKTHEFLLPVTDAELAQVATQKDEVEQKIEEIKKAGKKKDASEVNEEK